MNKMADELDDFEDFSNTMRHAYFKPPKESKWLFNKKETKTEDYSGVFLNAKDAVKVLEAYVSSLIMQIIEESPEISDEELETYREFLYMPIIYLAEANNTFVENFDYRAADLINISTLADNIS